MSVGQVNRRRRGLTQAILWVALIMLGSCTHHSIEIEFDVQGISEEGMPLRVYYYATDSKRGMMIEQVAILTEGKCRLKCPTKTATMLWVYAQGTQPSLAIYAEPGDKIKVTGTGSDPAKWETAGNKLDEKWSAWRKENAKTLESGNVAKINAAVGRYVKENPGNPLSALLMLTTYDRGADERGYASLWKTLKPKALKGQLFNAIGRSDQPDGNMVPLVECTELTLNVKGDSLMKVKSGAKNRTLLYFWNNNTRDRGATLSELGKHREGDKRIVDICVETDSTLWLSAMRNDSVTGTVRAWVPGGYEDKEIYKLGVPATPYFIVLDKKGKQIYRGSDLKQALRAHSTKK